MWLAPAGTPSAVTLTSCGAGMLVGRPAEVVERLLALHEVYPFDEAVFWARPTRRPAGLALENLERVAAEVAPALAKL